MRKKTINDIAELAGVSKATVSRSLHSPHLVKAGTRDRIKRVMESQDYVYDAVAGDLSRRKTSVLGLIIPTIKNSIFSNTVYGIQQKAEEYGYTTIIGNSDYDEASETRLIRLFQQRRMAGLIVTGLSHETKDRIETLVQSGIPSVVTWETLNSDKISYAGFDNYKAAYSMTSYLLRLRHRRIGLLIGPYSRVNRAQQRLEGYKSALRDGGIPFDPGLVLEREYTLVDGKEGMRALLNLSDPPTAVFAASDVLAMGALAAVKEKGLTVPGDVSLAGFDDIDFAAYLDPPLTTVKIPAFEMGQLAVKALIKMIDKGPEQVRQYCLETDLIVRKSCAGPK
ncbi:MAG: LacI family transcriptional regulator [Proteobacteria bacterium]|nr:LacI family transcriptional regulator [Pseudomonadota bacterium]